MNQEILQRQLEVQKEFAEFSAAYNALSEEEKKAAKAAAEKVTRTGEYVGLKERALFGGQLTLEERFLLGRTRQWGCLGMAGAPSEFVAEQVALEELMGSVVVEDGDYLYLYK